MLTSKDRELPDMAKLFEGFLDDGPQFVLRLVVFVLYGVGQASDKGKSFNIPHIRLINKLRVKVDLSILILFSDDIIFTLSMVTSYCAIVYYGLKFNERNTNPFAKWLICLPMFMASVAGNTQNALKSKKCVPKLLMSSTIGESFLLRIIIRVLLCS